MNQEAYMLCAVIVGHTVLGCLIGRRLCYSEGKCRVFLGYVFSRVWWGTCQWLQTTAIRRKNENIIPFQML